jgi:hypothetical protein
MAHEGQLWEMALEYFGSDGLLQVVVDMWRDAAPPPRPVVEHLTGDKVGLEVLNILNCPRASRSFCTGPKSSSRCRDVVRSSHQ